MGLSVPIPGLSRGSGLSLLGGLSAGSGLSPDPYGPSTPAAPVNLIAPVVSGIASSGQTLNCSPGVWSGFPTPTYTYQWQADGLDIVGATSPSLLLTDDEIGALITCDVSATNSEGGPILATSNAVGPVAPASSPPVNTVAPVVSGSIVEGSTLSVTDGTWTGDPAPTFAYQWREDGVDIPGQTADTLLLTPGLVGTVIDCRVTATNTAGTDSALSNAVGPIQPVGPSTGDALLLTTGDYLLLTDGGKLLLASAVSPIPSTALGWGSDALEWGAGDYITWG
jgi:hypothetical protein